MKKQLKQYEVAVQELAEYFAKRYFKKDYEMYWVADEIGGTLCVNDYFFDVYDIAYFVKYNYSAKDMFEYYDEKLKVKMIDINAFFPNIKNYRKLKNDRTSKKNRKG
jgi:hypothetical protein